MKKIALTLAAIAALSTAAFANSNRSQDLRDLQSYPYVNVPAISAATDSAAFKVAGNTGAVSNFERLTMQSIWNESSDN
jgi:hypothetical protein